MLEGSLEPTFERKLLSQSNAMQRKDGGRDVTCYPKVGRVMMMRMTIMMMLMMMAVMMMMVMMMRTQTFLVF